MTTVACVLKSGGIYDATWVARLQRGVARHISQSHRFVCLSDMDVSCERIPLEYDWPLITANRPKKHDWTVAPAWWSKVELFRKGLFGDDTVLYLDLDSLIVGSLDAIVAYPHRFTMAADPWRYETQKCSAVMAWRGDYSFIFDQFAANPDEIAHRYDVNEPHNGRIGDQAFIEDTVKADTFRNLFGGRSIASYKVDNCQNAPPADAAVVMFHGLPKMNDLHHGWVPAAWQ